MVRSSWDENRRLRYEQRLMEKWLDVESQSVALGI